MSRPAIAPKWQILLSVLRGARTRTSSGFARSMCRCGGYALLTLGVANEELRCYGAGAEHRALHGLDAAGIRASLDEFLAALI